ncbi:MAG: acyltransferase [Magnetococcales bacterium]|nr:acyltransferase [Magnetococcales bacterium]
MNPSKRVKAAIANKVVSWLEKWRTRYFLLQIPQVGEDVRIFNGLFVENPHNVILGNHVRINVNCMMQAHARIEIGDYTMIGASCLIVTANHDTSKRGLEAFDTQKHLPVKIGRHCWLGAGVTVLPGVTIGDEVVVGAGSTVTSDLPPGGIYAGSPARFIKTRPGIGIDSCHETL